MTKTNAEPPRPAGTFFLSVASDPATQTKPVARDGEKWMALHLQISRSSLKAPLHRSHRGDDREHYRVYDEPSGTILPSGDEFRETALGDVFDLIHKRGWMQVEGLDLPDPSTGQDSIHISFVPKSIIGQTEQVATDIRILNSPSSGGHPFQQDDFEYYASKEIDALHRVVDILVTQSITNQRTADFARDQIQAEFDKVYAIEN